LKIFDIIFISFFFLLQSEEKNYVAQSDVNFRQGPSTSYNIIDVIKLGDTVRLIENSNNYWAALSYKGREGYSSLSFFKEISLVNKKDENGVRGNLVINDDKDYNFSIFFIWLVFSSLLSISLYYLGKRRMRNRTIVVLLSVFTGFIGLQKFYLGRFFQGILCLLFFWTLIPAIVGLWDMIKFSLMSEAKFHLKFNDTIHVEQKRHLSKINTLESAKKAIQNKKFSTESFDLENIIEKKSPLSIGYIETKTTNSINKEDDKISVDSSIIDIYDEQLDTNIPESVIPFKNELNKNDFINSSKVPYWHKFYVYSYNDLKSANQIQVKFYNYFRDRLLNNQWTDIDGNTNYAFVLYFDLLARFEKHQDIELLENQLRLLGECCNETRNYSFYSLIELLNKRKDQKSLKKLEQLRDPSIRYELGFADYDPYEYRLGRIYKERLKLSDKHEDWLNKFYNPSNVFNKIEGCCVAIIKVYIKTLEALDDKLQLDKSSLDEEINSLKIKVRTTSSYDYDRYDFDYMTERIEQEIYLALFKTTENLIREEYGHKRKLSLDFPYTLQDINVEFEQKIASRFNLILRENILFIPKPDLDTQISLNAQNVNRWKEEFNEIKSHLKQKDTKAFIKELRHLEVTNQKNANIENIFFEASKAIASYDKTLALIYYAKYIDYDLKSDKIHNKLLSKTLQKSLFKDDEQLNRFQTIIQELINDQNIQDTLNQLNNFYRPTRKRIVLNRNDIKEATEKHQNTVDILSGYLDDDHTKDEENTTKEAINSEDEIEIKIKKTREFEESIFLESIGLNSPQISVLKMIADNGFTIQQNAIAEIALKNAQLKNQLIDSVNEICSNMLEGEYIIEEEGDDYIMEESFYNELLKK
tara:strand:- start:16063 stop:18672 length:2610 start_codon:yes stop_codon:yes gene_type:complete